MSRMMNNSRVLVLLIALLLVSNIAVLVYFLSWNKPARPSGERSGRGSVVNYVQKKLGLTEEQTSRYRVLYNNHHDSLRILGGQNRKARLELFRLLQQPNASDSVIQAAARAVGASQEAIELNNFRHFRRVRAICTSEQAPRLDSMVLRMVNRMPGSRGNNRSDSGRSRH